MDKSREIRNDPGSERNRTPSDSGEAARPIPGAESDAIAKRIAEVVGNESVSAFARLCGFGESLLRKYLAGSMPRADNLAAIADAGGVTVDWLATGRMPKWRSEARAAAAADRAAELAHEFESYLEDHCVEHIRHEAAMKLFVSDYNSGKLRKISGLNTLTEGAVYEARAKATGPKPVAGEPAFSADEYALISRYDVLAAAGAGALVAGEEEIGKLAFRRDWLKQRGLSQKDLAVIQIRGDSMSPTLRDGALVLVDCRETRPKTDGIYVIRIDDHLVAKRLQIDIDGGIVICSDNPAYQPRPVTPDKVAHLHIVGRVVWGGGDL